MMMMERTSRLKHRFNFISLLYLLILTAKASGLSACQGQPQTISISRGQKIAVVYWVGDNQSGDEDEVTSTVSEVSSSTTAPAIAVEVGTQKNIAAEVEATTDAKQQYTEGSESVLEERVAITEAPEASTQGLIPKNDLNSTIASAVEEETIDGKSEQNQTLYSSAVNSTIDGKSDDSLIPEQNNATVDGRNTEINATLAGRASDEDYETSTVQIVGKTYLNGEEVDEVSVAKVEDGTTISGKNVDESVTISAKSDISEDEVSTIAGKNSDVNDSWQSSTIVGNFYNTDSPPEERRLEDDQTSTGLYESDLKNRFRAVEETLTEVAYWNTTPANDENPSTADSTEKQSRAELEQSTQPPLNNQQLDIEQADSPLNNSLSGKSEDLNATTAALDFVTSSDYQTTEEALDQRSIDNIVQSSSPISTEVEGKNLDKQQIDSSSIAPDAFDSTSSTDNYERQTTSSSYLSPKALLGILTSTIKSVLQNTFQAESTTLVPEEDPLSTTEQTGDGIIFEETSKDPEIFVDPRLRNREQPSSTENETPPTITIIQLGDKAAEDVEANEEPWLSISSSSSNYDEPQQVSTTTVVSILETTNDDDENVKEEARKVIDDSSNFEFIPLEIINAQQEQEPTIFRDIDDSTSSVNNDYFIQPNYYSPNVNRFRIPQSRVHYVSMLRPPDGILPIQSLNFDSGYKNKRRRVLNRGSRNKRELNGTNCEWVFKSEPGVPLLLTFKSFSTPETEVCKDHYISVERESNGFISRWCGVSGEKPGHAAFARSEIRLQLHSKGDGTFPTGFSVEVQALDLKLLRKYAEVRRIVKGH